jgi:predicted glycosyltransferase
MADRLRIWIDLENTPHVLFFEPVIAALRRRGHEVVVSARRFAGTLALARVRGLPVHVIGSGYDTGRNNAMKRSLHYLRAWQLSRFARPQRFDVAVSHLSRTQTRAAAMLAIPVWTSVDYEHAYLADLCSARCFMIPDVVPVEALEPSGIPRRVIHQYSGLKEDVYLSEFRPAADVRRALRIADDELLVAFRPSADHAHYASEQGGRSTGRCCGTSRRSAACTPSCCRAPPPAAPMARARQRRRARPHLARRAARSVLIHAADLVVSGGGTMAREAAVLGVPAISCFTGPLGAVDAFLARERRIRLVRRVEDVAQIGAVVRNGRARPRSNGAPLRQIVDAICATAGRG